MSWAAPFTLALLPVAAWSVWWVFRRPRGHTRSVQFQQIRRLWADRHGLSAAPAATRRRARGLLLGLGCLGALLALARPQWGIIQEKSYDQSREVLLALDLSRSMLADDVSPTRLARAKLLIESLLDQLRGERVGLLVFAGTSFVQSPLSADYEVLREFLAELNPSYLPQGGTNYQAMLQTALKAFGQTGDGDRFLVVLSDGEAHDEKWQSLIPQLRERGIRVIGLGVGTATGGLVPDEAGGLVKDAAGAAVLSRLEPRTLQELATQTGGAYRDAASWVDIAELVNATVEQGRKGRYVEEQAVRLRDQYQWFLAPAVLLFLLSYWIEFPVLPLTRAMQARRRRSQAAPAAIAAAVTLCLAFAGGHRALGATPQPSQPTEPNALETLVSDLAARPELAAPDYAHLAQTTIEFASQPGAVNGAGLTGVVDDALRGVDRGEALDQHAANWPELRQALEQLKQPKEPPPQQPPQSDQQQQKPCDNPQQGEGQEGGGGGSASERDQQQSGTSQPQQSGQPHSGQDGNDNQNDASAQDGAEQSDDQPKDGSQSQQNGSTQQDGARPNSDQAGSDRAGEDGSAQQHDENDQQAQAGDATQRPEPQDRSGAPGASAQRESGEQKAGEPKALDGDHVGIGELDATQPPAENTTNDGNPSGTRLVGGGRTQSAADPTDPILAQALSEMDRIKSGDSPAVLFDRMNRADGAPPPDKNDKNW